MKKALVFLATLFVFTACNRVPSSNYPVVEIKTVYGNIYAEIYTDKAPKTSEAFLKIVRSGLYNGSNFYRAIKDPMQNSKIKKGIIQGGFYYSKREVMDSLPFVEHESPTSTGLSNTEGTLTMARGEVGSAKSEFFICIGDQTVYDVGRTLKPDGQGYAAFGRVIKGMDVARAIHKKPALQDLFYHPENIISITEVKK